MDYLRLFVFGLFVDYLKHGLLEIICVWIICGLFVLDYLRLVVNVVFEQRAKVNGETGYIDSLWHNTPFSNGQGRGLNQMHKKRKPQKIH